MWTRPEHCLNIVTLKLDMSFIYLFLTRLLHLFYIFDKNLCFLLYRQAFPDQINKLDLFERLKMQLYLLCELEVFFKQLKLLYSIDRIILESCVLLVTEAKIDLHKLSLFQSVR